jgi:aquaporin Z
MSLAKKSVAEFIGTFWLVLGGCGSAVLAAGIPDLGIGFVGVSLAFGLTVLTMAYAIGHISGCHLNPTVSVGLAVAGRFKWSELPAYVIAQVLGAIVAAGLFHAVRIRNRGRNDPDVPDHYPRPDIDPSDQHPGDQHIS